MQHVQASPAGAPPTVEPAELALWMGYPNPAAFQNAASKLVRHHGFPPKLAGRPVWSRRAVLEWIARAGGATGVEAISHEVPTIVPEFDEEDLETLYAGGRH